MKKDILREIAPCEWEYTQILADDLWDATIHHLDKAEHHRGLICKTEQRCKNTDIKYKAVLVDESVEENWVLVGLVCESTRYGEQLHTCKLISTDSSGKTVHKDVNESVNPIFYEKRNKSNCFNQYAMEFPVRWSSFHKNYLTGCIKMKFKK